MNEDSAEKCARDHLARRMELHPISEPLHLVLRDPSLANDCYWFDIRFPNEYGIGAGWVIGVRKTDGILAYFGTDSDE